jgi:hypothetical protein
LRLPTPQMAANRKYSPDVLMKVSTSGSNFVTMKAQNQLKETAIEAQSRLASGEYISALRVHAKGPNPIDK